jgi:hypothetical protein
MQYSAGLLIIIAEDAGFTRDKWHIGAGRRLKCSIHH